MYKQTTNPTNLVIIRICLSDFLRNQTQFKTIQKRESLNILKIKPFFQKFVFIKKSAI